MSTLAPFASPPAASVAIPKRGHRAHSIDASARKATRTPMGRQSTGSTVVATVKQKERPAALNFHHEHQTESRATLLTEYLNKSTVLNASTSFTPILTPKGDRSGMMIMLSPSRTISETLASLASSTGQQLEAIWDEIGLTPDNRAAHLSELMAKFRDLCDEKVSEEQNVVAMYRQSIAEGQEELQHLRKALKSEVHVPMFNDESPIANPSLTLMDQLVAIEKALSDMRLAAEEAETDLKDCLDFLLESHAALGIEMVCHCCFVC
jgi:Microtubule associated protein (MAP65/ASE1 family)